MRLSQRCMHVAILQELIRGEQGDSWSTNLMSTSSGRGRIVRWHPLHGCVALRRQRISTTFSTRSPHTVTYETEDCHALKHNCYRIMLTRTLLLINARADLLLCSSHGTAMFSSIYQMYLLQTHLDQFAAHRLFSPQLASYRPWIAAFWTCSTKERPVTHIASQSTSPQEAPSNMADSDPRSQA